MDLDELLQQYLNNNKLMQLATLGVDGQPWLCSVYFVHDEDNNLYWTSAREKRRHSREIKGDERVAATVVQDAVNKQALQITGVASEVSLDDAERVDKLYAVKYGDKGRLEEVLADLPEGRAYWKIEPTTISFWDEVNFPGVNKVEYK